jgi:hypothetical protein
VKTVSTQLAAHQVESFLQTFAIGTGGEIWGKMLDKATVIINKAEPTQNRCLLHTGAVNGSGYAMTNVGRRKLTASRLVLCCWTKMPLDYPFDACHDTPACQNRNCIAPWHLFWDTHRGNCERREAERLVQ